MAGLTARDPSGQWTMGSDSSYKAPVCSYTGAETEDRASHTLSAGLQTLFQLPQQGSSCRKDGRGGV